MRKTHDIYH